MSGSSPSTPKAAAGIASLSARETEILGKAWTCLRTGPPEIDYDKLAKDLSMVNPRSAANAWGNIKKKMGWGNAATPGTAKSTGKKRKVATSKAAAAAANAEEDAEEDDDDGSPIPKKKKTAAKPRAPRKNIGRKASVKAVAAANGSDDDDGEADDAALNGEHQMQSGHAEVKVKAEPEADDDESGDDVV